MQFGLFKETNLIDNANHRGRNRYTPATVVRRWQLFKLSAAVAGFAWREVPPAQGGLSRQLLLDSLGESGPLRQMRLARERLTSRAGSRGQRGGYPLAKRCWQHLARAIPLRGGSSHQRLGNFGCACRALLPAGPHWVERLQHVM